MVSPAFSTTALTAVLNSRVVFCFSFQLVCYPVPVKQHGRRTLRRDELVALVDVCHSERSVGSVDLERHIRVGLG